MFFSTYSKHNNEEELIQYMLPLYQSTRKQDRIEHKMNGPYQLAFHTFRKDGENPSLIMEYVSPAGAIYSISDGARLSEVLEMMVLHRHDFYELMFVLSGEVYVNIENRRHLYTQGCCCLLNRNVMHTEEYGIESRFVFLQLSGDFFAELYHDLSLDFFENEFSENRSEEDTEQSELLRFMALSLRNPDSTEKGYLDFVPLSPDTEEVKNIHCLFDRITSETLNPDRNTSLTVKRLFEDLLCQLSDTAVFSTTPVQIGSAAESSIYSQILSIMEQTHGRVSRSRLAEQLNYSGAYLNEITKKYSGLSIFDFGMTFCMKEAARLLLQSDENISEIGMELGFSNRSHFYKVFKEMYHMTPAEYRKKGAR